MPEAAPAIPEQVTFCFSHGGKARGKQAGVPATCTPEGAAELWTVAVKALAAKAEIGATLRPHGDHGTDSRARTVTAVAKSPDGLSYLLTCTVQT